MISLEALLTEPHGAGLTTASPAQRIICRVADGLPLAELASHEHAAALLGGRDAVRAWEGMRRAGPPREVYLLAGIRSGKSLIASTAAIKAAMSCDVSTLRHSDTPRASVLSLRLDLAKVVYDHALGTVQQSPLLRGLMIGEPTSDTITLRHVTGRPIEVKVVAGSRAGGSLVSRWSAGCIADEWPRMVGQDDGVVNFDDARSAVLGRLLPGAQLWGLGSPWAPFGPAYDVVSEYWGKPRPDLVVLRATGPQMHPAYWTAERCEELAITDPVAYRTDVLGEFASPETALFPADLLERQTRAEPAELPAEPGQYYVAAIDPATRGNSWTLVVLTRRRESDSGQRRVVLARQWTGSRLAPLSPDATLAEIADALRPYGVTAVHSDQWSFDALQTLAVRHGLNICQSDMRGAQRVDVYDAIRADLVDRGLELCPNAQLREDLQRVKRRVTQQGLTIDLPRTSDGRHCDYAAALALAYMQPLRCADERPDAAHVEAWRGWTDEEKAEVQAMQRRAKQRREALGV